MSLLHVFTTNTYRHTRCHVCESCRFSPPFSFFPFAAARGPQRSSLDQTTTKSIQTKCIHTKPYRPNQTHPHTHGGLSVPCCRAPTALGEQILVREHILRTCQCVVLPHSWPSLTPTHPPKKPTTWIPASSDYWTVYQKFASQSLHKHKKIEKKIRGSKRQKTKQFLPFFLLHKRAKPAPPSLPSPSTHLSMEITLWYMSLHYFPSIINQFTS
jgi:hypothetical protein